MDVHEVATRRTNKTFIQNKTIILKLECTINNESIYSLTDYVHIIRGVSSDGKYDCYFSTNSESEIKLLNEFKKTEIQIIEKKERPKNGFVLSEKTDLENTEAFKK